MSDRISNQEFLAVMEEAFKRGQKIKFTPSGTSMLPMLDGKNDTVTFAPKPDKLKKYDVAFYRRKKSGQLVLHRVVRVCTDGSYVFSGIRFRLSAVYSQNDAEKACKNLCFESVSSSF